MKKAALIGSDQQIIDIKNQSSYAYKRSTATSDILFIILMHPSSLPKVYVIQGAPERGGIYDYCAHLNNALARRGVSVEMFPPLKPGEKLFAYLSRLFAYIRQHKHDDCIFSLHYPGWQQVLQYSLIPQMLFLYLIAGRKGLVITSIHDLSKFNYGIRAVFIPLLLGSDALVFSTPQELDPAYRMTRWVGVDVRRKSALIPVGSNIEPAVAIPDYASRRGVVHFGHIRAGKGIEICLDVAEKLHRQGDETPFYIVGNLENWDLARYQYATSVIGRIYDLPERFRAQLNRCRLSEEYGRLLRTLKDSDKRLPNVHVVFDETIETTSQVMASCRFALMMFPDGASMRRSSLQAVLAHHCLTLTNWTEHTDDLIKSVTLEITSVNEIVDILTSGYSYPDLRYAMDTYLKAISWETIAASYQEFFARTAKRKRR